MVTDEGVIVIDPMNSQHAELTLEAIRGITQQPMRYVIYSHNYWDHISGGQVYKDAGATLTVERLAFSDGNCHRMVDGHAWRRRQPR